MIDELTITEKNALKWVLFRDFYGGLSDAYLSAQERYFKMNEFLKTIESEGDKK